MPAQIQEVVACESRPAFRHRDRSRSPPARERCRSLDRPRPGRTEGFEAHESKQFSAGPPSQLVADNRRARARTWGVDRPTVMSSSSITAVRSGSTPTSERGASVLRPRHQDHRRERSHATQGGRPRGRADGHLQRRRGRGEIEDMDVLGIGVQVCKPQGGSGGLQLFDVTDPTDPQALSFFPVPGGGVHELDMVTRTDGTTLALLAVPLRSSTTRTSPPTRAASSGSSTSPTQRPQSSSATGA